MVVVGVVGCRRPGEGGVLGVQEDAQEEYQMSALCTWGGWGGGGREGLVGVQELHKRCVGVLGVRLGVQEECQMSALCTAY